MDNLVIAGKTFSSRLIVGTGKYSSPAVMVQAHEASGADMITVAVRRVNISDRTEGIAARLHRHVEVFPAAEHRRLLHRRRGRAHGAARARGGPVELGQARSDRRRADAVSRQRGAARGDAHRSCKEGFVVLPYTNDDPVVCRKLEDAGAAAVMPLGAPIGSGLGIQNANNIRIIREFARVPVIVDAGVGTASDAALAMELGADGVLMNTAIAGAQDPVAMAEAMKLAVRAGRLAYLAGRIPRRCTRPRAVRSKGWSDAEFVGAGLQAVRARRDALKGVPYTSRQRRLGNDDAIQLEQQTRQRHAMFSAQRLQLLGTRRIRQLRRDHHHFHAAVLDQLDERGERSQHRIALDAHPLLPRIVVDEPDHLRRLVGIRELANDHAHRRRPRRRSPRAARRCDCDCSSSPIRRNETRDAVNNDISSSA